MIALRAAAVVALAIALTSSDARGDAPAVLVFGTDGPPRPGVVEALGIHLTGDATVVAGHGLAATTLSGRVDEAVATLRKRGALVAVWLDVTEQARAYDLVIYVIGHEDDLALLKIGRVVLGPDDDLDRALALKAGELIESLLVPAQPALLKSAIVAPAATRPVARAAAPSPVVATEPPPATSIIVELSGVLGTGTEIQRAFAIAAGGRLRRGALAIAALAGVRLAEDLEAEMATAWARERVYLAELRVAAAGARAELGAGARFLVRDVDAIGIAADGRRGTARNFGPGAGIAADARVRVARRVALRVAAGIEVGLRDHAFTLDGIPVLAPPRTRGIAELSVVISVD